MFWIEIKFINHVERILAFHYFLRAIQEAEDKNRRKWDNTYIFYVIYYTTGYNFDE